MLQRNKQAILAVNENVPICVGDFPFLAEDYRILRAGLLAETAEDTADYIDLVMPRVTFSMRNRVFRVILGGLQVNGAGRTGHAAQATTDTTLQPVRVTL